MGMSLKPERSLLTEPLLSLWLRDPDQTTTWLVEIQLPLDHLETFSEDVSLRIIPLSVELSKSSKNLPLDTEYQLDTKSFMEPVLARLTAKSEIPLLIMDTL